MGSRLYNRIKGLRWKGLCILGVLFYVIFLLARVPAAWLIPSVNQMLSKSRIQLSQPSGTIWQGAASLSGGVFDASTTQVYWDSRLWKLLLGRWQVKARLVGPQVRMRGEVAFGLQTLQLHQVTGQILAGLMNQALKINDVHIGQPLGLKRVNWVFNWRQKRSLTSSGQVFWPAGKVSAGKNSYSLPDIIGLLSAKDGELQLEARVKENDKASSDQSKLAYLRLLPSGVLQIDLYQEVLSVVDPSVTVQAPEQLLMQTSLGLW